MTIFHYKLMTREGRLLHMILEVVLGWPLDTINSSCNIIFSILAPLNQEEVPLLINLYPCGFGLGKVCMSYRFSLKTLL
jgi:hypothetical protein